MESGLRPVGLPSEELAEFNQHITSPIRVTDAYFGDGFEGLVPSEFMLAGKLERHLGSRRTVRNSFERAAA